MQCGLDGNKRPVCTALGREIVTFYSMVKTCVSRDNGNILGKGEGPVISYEPLWKTMQQRGVTTYTLINRHGINPRTINNLKHNRSITMFTLEKLCQILNCQAEGIVEFTENRE